MVIKPEYVGKKVRITNSRGETYEGKVEELEGPEETEGGEVEIGIEYAGGITMFAESELKSIEEI